MLILKNISKSYKPKKGKEVHALKDISLSFPETGMVFLLGKSGSGKSTLMNIIGGLDSTDVGEITFLGKQVSSFNQSEYDAYRNTQIGFVFQEFNLIESFSVYQNIALAMRLQNQKVSKGEVIELLETLDLKDEIDRRPYELSGGQKQRISIGRALIKNPKILLADEPTGALDSDTSKQIFNLLKSLSKSRLVIIVSHDRDFALAYGDRVIELSDGKVISDSNPEDYRSSDQTFDLKPPHLPLLDAFKIGLSAFFKRPVRMAITMLILTFSFLLFAGVHSVTNYNIETVAIKHAYKSNEEAFVIGSTRTNPRYDHHEYINYSQESFDYLKSKYPNRFMRPIYEDNFYLSSIYENVHYNPYYPNFAYGSIVIDEALLTETGYTLSGRLPLNSHEVVIPYHLAETYQKFGYIGTEKIDIEEPQDMIGKYLDMDYTVKVVGVIDTHFNQARYASVLENENSYGILGEELNVINDSSPHTLLYVHQSWIDTRFTDDQVMQFDLSSLDFYTGTRGDLEDMNHSTSTFSWFRRIRSSEQIPNFTILKPGIDITQLTGNQIIVSIDEILVWQVSRFEEYEAAVNVEFDRLVVAFADENYELNRVSLELQDDIYSKEELIQAIKTAKNLRTFDRSYTAVLYEEAQTNTMMLFIFSSDEFVRLRLGIFDLFRATVQSDFDVEIVGFIDSADNLVSPSLYQEISQSLGAYPYKGVFVDLSGNSSKDIDFLRDIQTLNPRFELMNEIHYMMAYNDQIMRLVKDKMIWFGLVLAVFTGILFHNFIHLSITHKKKDIGILRALGGRRKDIFTIFLTEAIFMGVIVSVISLLLTLVVVDQLDTYARSFMGLKVSFVWVEWVQVFWVFMLSIGVATLSSYLPIYRYSKQKPVDVIKVIES